MFTPTLHLYLFPASCKSLISKLVLYLVHVRNGQEEEPGKDTGMSFLFFLFIFKIEQRPKSFIFV